MTVSSEEKSLRRVLFISAMDGWSVAIFAGLCTAVSLLAVEWVGVGIGLVITGCGVMELCGRAQLKRGQADGLAWLIRAQMIILIVICLYAFAKLLTFDEAALMAEVTPEMRSALIQAGVAIDDFRPWLKPVVYTLYLTVIGVTLLFQGGLALYYRSCRAKVRAALAPRAPSALPPKL